MHEVMSSYNQIYRALGDLPVLEDSTSFAGEPAPVKL
jgi:hypothetical protein